MDQSLTAYMADPAPRLIGFVFPRRICMSCPCSLPLRAQNKVQPLSFASVVAVNHTRPCAEGSSSCRSAVIFIRIIVVFLSNGGLDLSHDVRGKTSVPLVALFLTLLFPDHRLRSLAAFFGADTQLRFLDA